MSPRSVVITGIGAINAAGVGAAEIHRSVSNGVCSLSGITRFDATDFPVQVTGEIKGFRAEDFVPKRLIVKSDRFTHFAIGASSLALKDAGLELGAEDPDRCGVWFGNDTGGWDLAERGFVELYRNGAQMVNPWGATAWFPTAPQGFTTIRFGITGQSKSFVADRASGAVALYFAWRAIRAGNVDVVLAGGTEAPITALGLTCYFETGEVSAARQPDKAYLPFDRHRNGLVPGEGSAVLVLEEKSHALRRGAPILGEILGAALTSDPDPAASKGFERAMQQALERANLSAQELDVVFADGSGGRDADALEARALRNVFGDQGPLVTCPKGAYGNLYGASGATDAVIGIQSMRSGKLPPVVGLSEPDEGMPARLVTRAVDTQISSFMVNARGREGVNASIVMGQSKN